MSDSPAPSPKRKLTQAERETLEAFCLQLGLVLRRITGKNIEVPLHLLPDAVDDMPDSSTSTSQEQESD